MKTTSKEVYDSIICIVEGRNGAPMGRANIGDRRLTEGKRIYCRRVPLTYDGAYDKGGAYWGCGSPLYVEYTLDKSYVHFFRKESEINIKEPEVKIKIAVLCLDVLDVDIITVNKLFIDKNFGGDINSFLVEHCQYDLDNIQWISGDNINVNLNMTEASFG